MMDKAAYDLTGRKIEIGDVLKVYHFQGARWRKHYYMYKQVITEKILDEPGEPCLFVSHLNMKSDPNDRFAGYYLRQSGQIELDTEIVQGLDCHHDRPRLTAQAIEARRAETDGAVHKSAVPTGCAQP